MRADLTPDTVSNEIATILAADVQRLSAIFGSKATEGLVAASPDTMPVWKNMRVLYEYVVEARLPSSFPIDDVLHELTDYFLETVPRSPMIDLHAERPIAGLCAWIVETAVVRWGLDFKEIGAFTIKQIATLANMDERSVRNAANPKLAEALVTFRDVDGSTKVAREDAIRWLEGRRSYKKTTFVDGTGERDLNKDGFEDVLDLREFIQKQAEKSGKSLAKILQDSDLEKEYADWIDGRGTGRFSFDVDRFRLLAKSLGLKHDRQRDFIVAACKVLQRSELAWLERKLRG